MPGISSTQPIHHFPSRWTTAVWDDFMPSRYSAARRSSIRPARFHGPEKETGTQRQNAASLPDPAVRLLRARLRLLRLLGFLAARIVALTHDGSPFSRRLRPGEAA